MRHHNKKTINVGVLNMTISLEKTATEKAQVMKYHNHKPNKSQNLPVFIPRCPNRHRYSQE